jgi:hypothetical protein
MKEFTIVLDWQTRDAVLATMHNKEKVIVPILNAELGLAVTVPDNFNTDQFGTFTRDVTRAGNQLEAARAKAHAALKLTGGDLAVASEGSFGSHPSLPFVPSNLEIVVLIDVKNNLEIVGHHRSSDIFVRGQIVTSAKQALDVATSWGFPEQGVIVRLTEKGNRNICKEITTLAQLETISNKLLSVWFTKHIYIETDLRAHRCPARMEAIKAATVDLVKGCKSLCPECTAPGFVITEVTKGLPCSSCGEPTERVLSLLYSCQLCKHQENRVAQGALQADPSDCEHCNP